MKLTSARIKNYRSIEDLTFKFDDGCHILLGINESGKSNILRALQLLDKAATTTIDDLRIARSEHAEVTEGSVRFEFELSDEDIEEIYEQVAKGFDKNSIDVPLLKKGDEFHSLKDLCYSRRIGIYEIALPSGKRRTSYYAWPQNTYSVHSGWIKSGASAIEVKIEDGVTILLTPKTHLYSAQAVAPEADSISIDGISRLIGAEIIKIVDAKLPECIFWKYADAYLLPSSVDIVTFSQNPETCMPLKSMFELAGYKAEDISELISSARAQAPRQQRYFNVLKRVSDAATKHIRRVWTDHKSIRIELKSDGPSLSPLITDDEVSLDMASRSDGFKRFVSFLLLVSAKVHTKEMNGVLLLVDEPEIGLHPGGARSLMRELVEIGQTNTVVYSTHSIFMVDPKRIGRHLIVEKKNEITNASNAHKSRVQDEEVLYAAMGYSVFETLKRRNVIFEGWRDKEIFRIACEHLSKTDKELKATMLDIGSTFAEGVKDVKNVAKFLELADRGCLIISDADSAAIARRKDYQRVGAWGTWLTLKDILGADAATTAEDLIIRSSLIKRANKFRSSIAGLPAIKDVEFHAGEPSISALKRWLTSAGATGDALEEQLNDLKNAIYSNLKRDELSADAENIVLFVKNYKFE